MGNPGMPMLARLGYSTVWEHERSFNFPYSSFFQNNALRTFLSRVLLNEALYPFLFKDLFYFVYTDSQTYSTLVNLQKTIRDFWFTEMITLYEFENVIKVEERVNLNISNLTLFTPVLYYTAGGCCILIRYFPSSENLNILVELWTAYTAALLDGWVNLRSNFRPGHKIYKRVSRL